MIYKNLLKQASALLESQPNQISLLANASAFLNDVIPNLNWVGFYLFDQENLTVGPFQGKVACSLIKPGAGVCGTALVTKQTQVVPNVHKISNHIVCDENSNSEVVVPIIKNNLIFGVLDVDSPIINRFDSELVSFLENFVVIITNLIDI